MKTILFKFASRSRPDKFFGALDNIVALIDYPHYKILCSLDFDDMSMNNPEVKRRIGEYKNLRAVFWKSNTKVEAFNRDMQYAGDWDIGVLMSDDMVWIKQGFGQTIVDDFERCFPEGDGVLHYPEIHSGENIIPMTILDKKYYDRDGYWYNPIYHSVYCDNEFMAVAQQRGRYAFVNDNLYFHTHPAFGLGISDDLYDKNESSGFYLVDETTFNNRKLENFGL